MTSCSVSNRRKIKPIKEMMWTIKSNHLTPDVLPVLLLLVTSAHFGFGGNGRSGYNYTSFLPWLITCHASQPPLVPTSLSDLQSIVQQAIRNGMTLKPLGNMHSCTDIICTSGVPINMERIDHFTYDPITGHATVGAGLTFLGCLDKLHKHRRTLLGVPTSGQVTIGGALGGGTHGTGKLTEPGTIADQVISLIAVDGRGMVRNISKPEVLRAFKANLGLLGIVYEVVIATVAQFKLQIRHFPNPERILWEEESHKILSYVRNSDRFQLWWFPTAKQVVLSVGQRLDYNASGHCETHFLTEASRAKSQSLGDALETMQKEMNHLGMFALQAVTMFSLMMPVPGRSPMFSERDNNKVMCFTKPPVGFSHKMVLNSCTVCSWDHRDASVPVMEFSVAIPLQEFHKAVIAIRNILDEYPVEFPLNGIYIRFLSKSDGLMMVNGGRETVVIEWVMATRRNHFRDPTLGIAGSQALMQALMALRGKPHWSKNGLYYSSQNVLMKAFPEFPKFLQMMEDFDPYGVFLNEVGARLRFGSSRTSIDRWVEHCALVDNCICKNDNDCGGVNRRGSLVCGELMGYKVCRENPEEIKYSYKAFRGKVVRKFIKTKMWKKKISRAFYDLIL